MAVTSNRRIAIKFDGDLEGTFTFDAAQNVLAPGDIDVFSLLTGFNIITLPTGGSTPKGATIIPPAGNTQTITLKGITSDTGVALSKTDPTSIAFDTTPPVSFGLTVGGNITGLRIVWT